MACNRSGLMMDERNHTVEVGALLFDFDGVLADSRDTVVRHWLDFAHTFDLDPDALLSNVHGRRSVDIISEALSDRSPRVVRDAIDDFESRETADTSGITALPGAAELLARLPGHRWAIVTSGSRKLVEARLAAVRLPTPAVIVAADDVERGKPHPDGYRAAAELLGVPPGECLVVEDAPSGVIAARAAGARVLALSTTHDSAVLLDELGEGDVLARDLAAVHVAQAAPDGPGREIQRLCLDIHGTMPTHPTPGLKMSSQL
jgi:sugar-phosphatase